MKQATVVVVELTVEEIAFIKETRKLTLAAYDRTVAFYSKYSSDHSKKIVAEAHAAHNELLTYTIGKTRKQQQNILIKHLSKRAAFLLGFENKKDEGQTNRCHVVGNKIIDVNKKLRQIKKLEGKKA